ncbi:MAG: hypothetical protein LKG24_00175 [Lacticaseibacillus songhuajiangensis]|jgi:hypothetical protein|nr:hypothetical protein [Lacticaseibacillus songhuajiangensis]
MQKLAAFDEPFFKKALKSTNDMVAEIKRRMANRDDRDEVLLYGQQQAKTIVDQFNDDRTTTIQELNDNADRIEAKYRVVKYPDAEQELLRRQDWNTKLKMASPEELTQLAQDAGKYQYTAYEFNTLKMAIDNSAALSQAQKDTADAALVEYEQASNVDRPYLNDAEYKKAYTRYLSITSLPEDTLWEPVGTENSADNWQPFTPLDKVQETLEGYTVSLY